MDIDLTNMAKIQITENDIRGMVSESIEKLMEMRTELCPSSIDGAVNATGYIANLFGVEEDAVAGILKQAGLPELVPFDIRYNGGVSGAGPDDYDDCEVANEAEVRALEDKAKSLKETSVDETQEKVFGEYEILCNTIRYVDDYTEFENFKDGELSEYFVNFSHNDESWFGPDPDEEYESRRDAQLEENSEDVAGIGDVASEGKIFLPNIFGTFNTRIKISPVNGSLEWEYAANEDGTVPNKGEIPWRDSEIESQIARHEERIWAELSK